MNHLRYRLGARLLRPWIVSEMQHWNGLASVYVTREKQWDAMSRRDALVPFVNGEAFERRRLRNDPYPQVDADG